MRKLREKINGMSAKLSAKVMCLRARALEKSNVLVKLSEEDGDTNFLSIMIVLGIVLVVAALFIVFKDQILGLVQSAWNSFMETWNNQTTT